MKNIFKNKWFPLIAAVAILLLAAGVVFTMLLHGWRLTYAPDLETDWDAVSAVAAWGGVFASFGAIMVAIWIPKRIADRQDKIALFEKRYECFQIFEKCHMLYAQIKDNECTLKELRNKTKYLLGKLDWGDVTREVAMEQIERYEHMIHQMQFLFPGIDEIDAYMLYINLQEFIVSVIENRNIEVNKERYISTMRLFSNKYAQTIWKSLSL